MFFKQRRTRRTERIEKTVHDPTYSEVKKAFNDSPDLICREMNVDDQVIEIIYMKNLTKNEVLNAYVIQYLGQLNKEQLTVSYLLNTIPINEVMRSESLEKVVSLLIHGFVYIYIAAERKGLLVNCSAAIERPLEKPEIESIVYGPKIAFTESISTNIKIIRHNVNDPHVK